MQTQSPINLMIDDLALGICLMLKERGVIGDDQMEQDEARVAVLDALHNGEQAMLQSYLKHRIVADINENAGFSAHLLNTIMRRPDMTVRKGESLHGMMIEATTRAKANNELIISYMSRSLSATGF